MTALAPLTTREDVETRVLIILSRHGVRLSPEQTNALVRDLITELAELGISDFDTQPSPNGHSGRHHDPYAGERQETPQRDRRAKAKNPTPHTRVCSACGEAKRGDEFYWSVKKGRKTPTPSSSCKSCVNARARSRYLSSARIDALNRVRLEFTADQDEAGLRCIDCDEPVAAGDGVVCESGVRHGECGAQA